MEDLWQQVKTFYENSALISHGIDETRERSYTEEFMTNVNAKQLFELLNIYANEEEKIKILCECLKKILDTNYGKELLISKEMEQYFILGLCHASTLVRQLTLTVLNDNFGDGSKKSSIFTTKTVYPKEIIETKRIQMMKSGEMNVVMERIQDEETETSSIALAFMIQCLPSITKDPEIAEGLFIKLSNMLREMEVQHDTIASVRYIELICRLFALPNEEISIKCKQQGLMKYIETGIQSTDILYAMSIIELLPLLLHTKNAIEYIFQSGILQFLNTIQDPLLSCMALQIQAQIYAASYDKLSTDVVTLRTMLFAKIETILTESTMHDMELILSCFTALARICCCAPEDLDAMLHYHNGNLCERFLSFTTQSNMEMKCKCISSIADILAAPTSINQNEQQREDSMVWTLNQDLMNRLAASCNKTTIMEYIMPILQTQPFEEMRLTSYYLLRSIAAQNHRWGIELLQSSPTFIKFIMNQSTESTKRTKEWKFTVIDAILHSPYKTCFTTKENQQLSKILKQGPYSIQQAMLEDLSLDTR